ncbi:MAG: hypothetical protein K2N64_02410 [Anaeroplasmataceae bacterium]|nr:hypothetical protein [Anaeroplasmataceae bacterium]
MVNMVKWYRGLSFEERTLFHAKFSIIFNFILAVGKVILGFFVNAVFFVTAVVNGFMMLSRLECYLGVTKPNSKSFWYRNNFIGAFLVLAGVQYTFYMVMLWISRFETRSYTMIVGIVIAFVSFIELGVAIKGCFNAYGRGHYYRNIKMTNLCSALTAIALTEMAITSFSSVEQNTKIDNWFGLVVGISIILMGCFVFIAPLISIVDRKRNVYQMTEDSDFNTECRIRYQLTKSRIYGNYFYIGRIQGGLIRGVVVKGKNPILQFNIFVKMILILFSEILIFPYAVGALIFHFRCATIIKKLDQYMISHGCIKIVEQEEEIPLEENILFLE